jgi:hypothetical protein
MLESDDAWTLYYMCKVRAPVLLQCHIIAFAVRPKHGSTVMLNNNFKYWAP